MRETLEFILAGEQEPEGTYGLVEDLSLLDRIVRGRLAGRENELSATRELWTRTAHQEGQVLLVSGEPGIGKTRLVRELETQVKVSGAKAFVGECYPDGSVPYAPFGQILRKWSQNGFSHEFDLPEFVLADLLTIAPALRLQHPDVPLNPPLDPHAEQFRLFEGMVAFLVALNERSPLLLVLEDVHWADSGTLSMFQHLTRRMKKQRVMIVVTYREVELDEARPVHDMLMALN